MELDQKSKAGIPWHMQRTHAKKKIKLKSGTYELGHKVVCRNKEEGFFPAITVCYFPHSAIVRKIGSKKDQVVGYRNIQDYDTGVAFVSTSKHEHVSKTGLEVTSYLPTKEEAKKWRIRKGEFLISSKYAR